MKTYIAVFTALTLLCLIAGRLAERGSDQAIRLEFVAVVASAIVLLLVAVGIWRGTL